MRNGATWVGLLLLLTVRVGFDAAGGQPPAGGQRASEPATLTGLVTSASTGGPLPQARVEIFAQPDPESARQRHGKGDLMGEPLARAAVDAAGRFRIAVPPGLRLVVVADAPGHQRSFLAQPTIVNAPSERNLGTLELPRGRRLTGKVLDAAGKPVAGARVMALMPTARAQRGTGAGFARSLLTSNLMPAFPTTARTTADGSFVMDCVPERAVTVRAWADKLAPALASDVQSSTVTIRMAPGHPMAGKVVAPDGKTPVAGAWVLAGDEGYDGVAQTVADGSFRFENLRKGQLSLTATTATILQPGEDVGASRLHAPSAPQRVTLPVAPPAAPSTLRLRPGAIVRARALDTETRQPVPGAAISLNAPGEMEPRPATTAASGEVVFTGVPVGTIRLSALADGYLREELDGAPVAAGQTREWSAALRPAAAIEGTVRDESGHPVAGAEVSISGLPPMFLPVRAHIFFPIGIEPVHSDGQGNFVIEKLPPRDELKVQVQRDGFASWEMSGIKLRPGERRKGMEVLLDAGVMISGRVVGGGGQPVAGAAVTASRKREGGPGGVVIRMDGGGGRGRGAGRGPGGGPPGMDGDSLPEVLTGPDGVFRVRGATAGIWSVSIAAKGFAPKSVSGLKLDDAAGSLDAGQVVLEPGARISGRVATASGEAVAYARGSVRKEFSVLSEFTTGSDGLFETDDMAAGDTVNLAIDADAYAAVEKRGLTPPMEDLTITLVPSSRVTGQVIDRETRRPIPDFSIGMSRLRTGGGGGMVMNMVMGGPETPFHADDGTFVVEDVDPGSVAVTARAPGYRESTLRDQEVPEGKDLEGLSFALERAGVVSGTVIDDKGLPLPGVAVAQKVSGSWMGFRMRSGGSGGEATTDGDGKFALAGLDHGPMTLTFMHRDFEPAEKDVDTSRDVEGLRVVMSRGATVTGVVLHQEDGSPVAGATVAAVAAGSDRFGGERSATTGPDGTFSLEAMPAGRYSVRAEATGLRGASIEDLVVEQGAAPPPLELRLSGGVSLTGTITGVKEQDLPQFTVRAVSSTGVGTGGFGVTAPVDAAGRFEFKGMAAGTVTLIASSGFFGARSATRTVQIPESAPSFDTTIEFPQGSTVEGDVTRGGKPIDGATVIFSHNATRARVTATANTAGHYTASDLDDGEYSVDVVQFASGVSFSTKVTVKGDRRFDVELPLAKLGGIVRDAATGLPLDRAVVAIKMENAVQSPASMGFMFRQQEARTDATGYFAIDGLEEGTYTLTARKDGYGFDSHAVTIVPSVQPDDVAFELTRVEGFAFRALEGSRGLPLKSVSALVLVGGGDPLAANGSGATTVFRDQISADATGLFRLDSLKPGTYRIVLGGQLVATETLYDVAVPGPETTITLPVGGSVEVTCGSLKSGDVAKGVLVDAQGRPVHTNTFLAEPTFNLRATQPTTLSDIPPGSYRLRASMPGGTVKELPLEVLPGETARLTVP